MKSADFGELNMQAEGIHEVHMSGSAYRKKKYFRNLSDVSGIKISIFLKRKVSPMFEKLLKGFSCLLLSERLTSYCRGSNVVLKHQAWYL